MNSTVVATVNYISNRPATGKPVLEFVTEHEERNTMVTLPGREMVIRNARGRRTDLDREGFVLVEHTSAVSDFERIEEDPETDELYRQEMGELLKQVTGADLAWMIHVGKKRFAERAVEKWSALLNAKPARYPHADNTDTSAPGQVEVAKFFMPGVDLSQYRRWALFNLWRCVSPPPQDVPLAVCDARTVRPDTDEVTVLAVTETRQRGEYRHDTTGYMYNPDHDWNYFPDMTPSEVLIFKAHDSDPSRAGRVPHTAFDDPTCPPDAPVRASVEMRGIALFA
ncbi:MAG: CmcJ/NvfI family oxidoreductase [Acidimicrobiia bacterium]